MKFQRNPQEKRKAILETAEAMFYKKGYEKTSVNMIIEKLNISKGAFYHHFKSKLCLLDAVAEFIIRKELKTYDKIFNDSSLNPIEKFNNVFNISKRWKIRTLRIVKNIIKTLYNDDNITMRRKIFRKNIEIVAPKIDKLIEEGIYSGYFNIADNEKMGEVIINIDYTMNEDIAYTFIYKGLNEKGIEEFIKKMNIYQLIYQNLLGLDENSIKLFDKEEVVKLFK